jgi:2-succinyl-6-hydroxy-2,4-cyclohexadiene-1-carboxylate synthase
LLPKDTHILALHGFTGGGADFSSFMPYCGQSLIWSCPDLPGHGPNPLLDCSSEAMVAFIEAQRVNALADGARSRKILLGYSMGARAALQHACAFPDSWDALILISTNPGVQSAEERLKRRNEDSKLVTELKSDGLQNFMLRWQEQPLIRSQKHIKPENFNAMQATRRRNEVVGLAANLTQFGQGSAPNLWNQLSDLKLPVLIITGSLDSKYQRIGAQIDEQLLHSKHVEIKDASHMPHLEKPLATAEVIRTFIAGLTSTI